MKYIASCSFGEDRLMLHELQETPNTSRRCFTKSKTIFELELRFREEMKGTDNEKGNFD